MALFTPHTGSYTTYYVAASADGFIAGPDDDLSWLPQPEEGNPALDFGFSAFYNTVEAVVMGAGTYRAIQNMDEGWHYAGKPAMILSRSEAPTSLPPLVHWTTDIYELFDFKAAHGHTWLVGGGDLAGQLTKRGWIDFLELATVPIILGNGTGLFGTHTPKLTTELLECRQGPMGTLLQRYVVAKP